MVQVGAAVGNYQVTRLIGEGGMGAVFEAVHQYIGRRAAIKVLHADLSQNPQFVTRFLNEARAVNLVRHPGLVEIFEFGMLPDGTAFCVMEYLEGVSLFRRLREAPPQARWGLDDLRLVRQMAQALQVAHDKGIVHRDLKPENVMIVPDPERRGRLRAKVLDFGIAKMAHGSQGPAGARYKTQTGIALGTPEYMAPEQCMGEIELDGKADVYSLGVMLYEIVAGQLPFRSDLAAEIMVKHVREAPRPLRELDPSVPPELEALVLAMLAKPKAERPTMAQVASALRTMLEAAKASGGEPAVSGADLSGLAPAELLAAAESWDPEEEEERTEVSVLAAQGGKERGAAPAAGAAGLAERRDATPFRRGSGDFAERRDATPFGRDEASLAEHGPDEATVTHAPALGPPSADATTPGAPALVLGEAPDLAATVAHHVVPDLPRAGAGDPQESLAPAESLGAEAGLRGALSRRRLILPVGLGVLAAAVVLAVGLSRGPTASTGSAAERAGRIEPPGSIGPPGAAPAGPAAPTGSPAPTAPAARPGPAVPAPPTCAITSVPDGAEVLRASDRALLGQTPLRLEKPPGAAAQDVILRRKGYAEQRVALSFGADCRRQVTLSPPPRAPGRRNDRAGKAARPAPGGSSVPIPIIH